IRADIYGLGGTLYWCLTGQPPFTSEGNFVQRLMQRQTQGPPSIRTLQPDVPAELDAVVARMMASRPEDRYPAPHAVMNALLPFLRSPSSELNLGAKVWGEGVGNENGGQRVEGGKSQRAGRQSAILAPRASIHVLQAHAPSAAHPRI